MPHPLSNPFDFKSQDYAAIHARAESGDLEAIAIGAAITFQGFNIAKVDTLESIRWLEFGAQLEKEANSTDKLCTVTLAMYQAASIGITGKEEEGRNTLVANRKWIVEQAGQGHIAVNRILSFMHGRGRMGVESGMKKAVEVLERHADKDDPFTLYDLGLAYSGQFENIEDKKYEHLRQIKIDLLKAARFFQRAALMGHADAQRELGLLIPAFLAGNNAVAVQIAQAMDETPADKKDAVTKELARLQDAAYGIEMLETSAAQGRIAALYSLGLAHLGSPGFKGAVPRDLAKAMECFKQADELGFPRATFELAKIYEAWLTDVAGNDPAKVPDEVSMAAAYANYAFLLGRPRRVRNMTITTQPLPKRMLPEVEKRHKALEEQAVAWNYDLDKTGVPTGSIVIDFKDGSSARINPSKDDADPSRDVARDMERAAGHASKTSGIYKYSPLTAYNIYRGILARVEGGEYALPTEAQRKAITAAMGAIEKAADDKLVQENGRRTLIYKMGGRKPDELIFAAPDKNWEQKQKRAEEKRQRDEAKAARQAGQSGEAGEGVPTRPDGNAKKGVNQDPDSKRKP